MVDLDQDLAEDIIDSLGETGQPPSNGEMLFTCGLSGILEPMENTFFKNKLKKGKTSFKVVLGENGSGKTHLLYCIRDLALRNNFVVSYVELSAKSCPFNDLSLVYKEIVKNLYTPQLGKEVINEEDIGLEALCRSWLEKKKKEIRLSEEPVRETFPIHLTNSCIMRGVSW